METNIRGESEMNWLEALDHEARTLVEALETQPLARRLFEGNIDAAGYAHYLVQTYHYVRWSTPMLAEAGHRLKRQGRLVPLAELLIQKASEERGHERWLLADLKNLGWSAEQVEGTPCSPAVAAYVAWNRYTTRAGAPTAFLGTAYVLEYLSVKRASQTVKHLLAAKRIPNIHKAVTFLRGHGAADEHHVAELTSVLRSLTDQEEQCALLLSARTTRVLYTGFFSDEPQASPAHTP